MKGSEIQKRTTKGGPDQGWAWMIAIACFIINFILAGLARTAGVLYVALIDLYGISRESATTPFSIRVCVRNMTGPIIGLLGQRYGIRPVTSIGALFAAVGGMLCFVAPNVFWITIFWGVIHGIGFGLSTVLHMMAIDQYFDKYKASAMGLGYSGDCVGTFVFPVLIEGLIEAYGVKGTFLILGGIVLNVLPSALLLKTPPWIEENKTDTCKKQVCEGKTGIGNASTQPSETSEAIMFNHWKILGYYPYNVSDICRGLPVQLINLSERTHSFNSTTAEHDKERCFKTAHAERTVDICQKLGDSFKDNQLVKRREETEIPCRMFIVESHQTLVESPLTSSYTNKGFIHSSLSVHQTGVTDDVNTKECHLCDKDAPHAVLEMRNCCSHKHSVPSCMTSPSPQTASQNDGTSKVSSILATVGSVITSPMFNIISITMAVYAFLFVTVLTIIIDFGVDKGISQQEGKYLVIGFSAADLVGRLSFGGIIDKKLVSLHCYAMITVTIMAVLVAAIPWCPHFSALMGVMISYGLIQGGTAIMFPILIGNYMKREEANIAKGCMNFYGGLIMLGMAPMIGFFRDQYGSYDGIFYIIGAMGALTGCLWLLEPFVIGCKSKTSQEDNVVTSDTVPPPEKV